MDIKDPNQKFTDELDKALRGQALNERDLLDEDKDLLRLAQSIQKSSPEADPDENFALNLRKRLVNEYSHILSGKKPKTEPQLLSRGRRGLLPRPRRRWAWAMAPLAVVALLAVFTSFALASPGFYEKYVPRPVKNMLKEAAVVKTGDLSITSRPAGAQAYLNGRDLGETPVEISDIREGEHTLRLTKEGFVDVEQSINVLADQNTPIDITMAAVPAEIIEDGGEETPVPVSAEDLIFVSGDSLYKATSGSGEVGPIASFTSPIRGAVSGADGSLYYFYETEGSNNILAKLSPSGEQAVLSEFPGSIFTPLVISQNGRYLAYVGNTSAQQEIHLVDITAGTDEILATFAEDLNLTHILGIVGENLYFVRAETKGVEVTKFSRLNIASGEEGDLASPDNVDGNSFVLSPDARQILTRTTSGQPAVFTVGETELREFSIESSGPMAWAGETPSVSVADGVMLLNLDSNSSKKIFEAGAIIDLTGSIDGNSLGILTGQREPIIYSLGEEKTMVLPGGETADGLAGLVPAGSWSVGERLYAPDSTNANTKEIGLLSQTELSSATAEDLLVEGNYAYRLTNGGDNLLEVISLEDPNNPQVIATLPAREFPQGIEAAIAGNKLVAVGGRTVVIDISDPASPQVLSDATSSADKIAAGTGDIVYIATPSSLQIVDVIGEPQILGEVSLPAAPYDIESYGNYVYVASGDGGYIVVSVSDPANPGIVDTKLGKFYSQIAVLNDYIYVWGSVPGGNDETDVFRQGSVEAINTVASGVASGGEVAVADNKLYSHYPDLKVQSAGADGELIPLIESQNDAIITVTGNMAVADNLLLVLSEDTLFVFNANNVGN